MKTRLFLTVALFAAMTIIASAQTTEKSQVQTGKGRAAGNAWVDANKDGVCDNYENGTRMGRRAYSAGENQTAMARGAGKGQGKGKGMHAGQGQAQGRGKGVAAGKGQARGKGQGPAFVDANNDGICDNLQAANQPAPAKK